MRVAIIGPNLYDQSKGSFHVHEASCRDGLNARKYPIREGYRHEADVIDAVAVAEWVYEDHLGDHGLTVDTAEGREKMIADYLPEFHFHGCLSALPTEIVLTGWHTVGFGEREGDGHPHLALRATA